MNEFNETSSLTPHARALVYDALAGLFSYHFGLNDFSERVTDKEANVVAASRILGDIGYRCDFAEMFNVAQSVGGIDELGEVQTEYVALFDRPSPSHALSPFESVQRKGVADLTIVGDVKDFYERFGLTLAPDASETADHCSMEFAFMSSLAFREAEAIRLEADGQRFHDGQLAFLSQHMMQWMPKWLPNLEAAARHPYFAAAARVAQGFLAEDAERHGIMDPGAILDQG